MKAAFVALVLLIGGGSLAVASEQRTKFKCLTRCISCGKWKHCSSDLGDGCRPSVGGVDF